MKPMVNYISETYAQRPHRDHEALSDFFVGIRQCGVVMGLEFDYPEGAKPVMKHLYENGVWAIFSTLDPARAAIQARRADDRRSVRRSCWSGRTRDRPRARECMGSSSRAAWTRGAPPT